MKYQNLKIGNHGKVNGEVDGNKFMGQLSSIVIQTAWLNGCDFSKVLKRLDWNLIKKRPNPMGWVYQLDEEESNLCLAEALNFINEKLK